MSNGEPETQPNLAVKSKAQLIDLLTRAVAIINRQAKILNNREGRQEKTYRNVNDFANGVGEE